MFQGTGYSPSKLPERRLSDATLRGKTCAVAACKGPYAAEDNFHAFPKDAKQRQAWVKACKRKDTINMAKAEVCGRHFKEEDFDRDLRSELLYGKRRKKLNRSAVPTQNLYPSAAMEDNTTARQQRAQKREQQSAIHSLLSAPAPRPGQVDKEVQTDDDGVRAENTRLMEQVKALQQELEEVKQLKKQELSQIEEVDIAKKVLSKTAWSTGQINFFVEDKIKGRWSPEDIVLGLTLRSQSRRMYQMVRKKRLLPLPGLETLRRYVSNFTCPPGILDNVLKGTQLCTHMLLWFNSAPASAPSSS